MTDPYTQQLEHLVAMARIPGARDHAEKRIQRLEAHASGLWVGIEKEWRTALAAPPPSSTTETESSPPR